MKYTNEITIDLPRAEVVNLFDDPNYLQHWQPGFQELLPIEGKPGDVGSKSKLSYINGTRYVELIETILKRDLPRSFSATYETRGVYNRIDNEFHDSDGKTRWVAHNEFKFSGIMKLFAWAMTGTFKRHSMIYMENFKIFAEERSNR